MGLVFPCGMNVATMSDLLYL